MHRHLTISQMLRCSIIAWQVFNRQLSVIRGPGVYEGEAVTVEVRDVSGCKGSAVRQRRATDQRVLDGHWAACELPFGPCDCVTLSTCGIEQDDAFSKSGLQKSLKILLDFAPPSPVRQALHAIADFSDDDTGQIHSGRFMACVEISHRLVITRAHHDRNHVCIQHYQRSYSGPLKSTGGLSMSSRRGGKFRSKPRSSPKMRRAI